MIRNTLLGEEEVDDTRVCYKCGEEKPITEFGVRVHGRNGAKELRNDCKPCNSEQTLGVNKLKKEHPQPNKDTYKCPICLRGRSEFAGFGSNTRKNSPFVLDHNHETGEFRGYVCDYCNVGMSRFNEDIEAMKRAIEYLQNNGVESRTILNNV